MIKDYYFSESAFREYKNWLKHSKKSAEYIIKLIDSIMTHGLINGIGKPEKLKYSDDYSLHINKKDRLTYHIDESGKLFITSCKAYYNDH